MVTIKNKFDILQETPERHSPNDEYENFVTAHIEAVAECMPTKCKVPWESIAWQTVNEVSGNKGTFRVKVKAARQEERLQKWKEHFKNLFGNSLEVTDELIKILLRAN